MTPILTSKKQIIDFFKQHRLSPSKKLGQNFLVDKKIMAKILKVAELSKRDVVLEIGPGIGNLTKELAKRVKKVIAIEKDQRMVKILKETLRDFKNVGVVQEDIRKLEFSNSKFKARNPKQIPNSKFQFSKDFRIWDLEHWDFFRISNLGFRIFKVVANIPYYLTSPLIRKFLESKNPPKLMVLMVQKEVAQRICGLPKMNLLAVSVQFYAKPEIISYVSKKSFWPQPKVDSAIIKITPHSKNLKPTIVRNKIKRECFFKIVKAGFSQPRKHILNNLAKKLKLEKEIVKSWLLKNQLKPEQRAEDLQINDWLKLTESFPLY